MTKNEIKYYSKLRQKKYRDSENKFLIEGDHLIEECLKSKNYRNNLSNVFIRNDYGNIELQDKLRNCGLNFSIEYVSKNIIDQLTETVNSQGIIGIVSKHIKNNLKDNSRFIVALDSINDPGNLGTIIRTCHWFSVDQLLIGSDSVDMFNSKVIRASQGALFNLYIKENSDLENELNYYFKNGFKIILTDLNSDQPLFKYKFRHEDKYIFVFGNEALGINKSILDNKNYLKLKITGFSDCESLNISVAAGIVLNTFKSNS